MAREQSAEEVRQEHLTKLGKHLGAHFNAVHNELAWSYMKWRQYESLFGTNARRLDLLNETAPLFFRMIQDSMWEDTLLGISRLTDRRRGTLSIRRFPPLLHETKFKRHVEELTKEAEYRAEWVHEYRNRLIAHRELSFALREPTTPLPPANRAKVNTTLSAIADVVNAIHIHYFHSEVGYHLDFAIGGAVSLLYRLRDGLQADKDRQRRLQENRLQPEDLRPVEEL